MLVLEALEDRIPDLGLAKAFPEGDAKTLLPEIGKAAAIIAYSAVFLETLSPVGVDHLDRGRILFADIASSFIEETGILCDERDGGDGLE